jgi:hypothetical protein
MAILIVLENMRKRDFKQMTRTAEGAQSAQRVLDYKTIAQEESAVVASYFDHLQAPTHCAPILGSSSDAHLEIYFSY